MADLTMMQAADEARKLLNTFRAIEKLETTLREAGSIEQAAAEAVSRLAALRADIEAAEQALADARIKTDTAKEDAAAVVREAKAKAKAIEAKAAQKAEEIEAKASAFVAEAQRQAGDFEARANLARADLDALQAQVAEARRLIERAEAAKAALAQV